jgi:hypothetical protein
MAEQLRTGCTKLDVCGMVSHVSELIILISWHVLYAHNDDAAAINNSKHLLC